jgi:hypothetical protein
MGSLKRHHTDPRKQHTAFDPDELETIDRVYRAAWSQILTRHPGQDVDKARERQAALGKRLFILAGRWPVEFDTLRDRVLATIPETLMYPTR